MNLVYFFSSFLLDTNLVDHFSINLDVYLIATHWSADRQGITLSALVQFKNKFSLSLSRSLCFCLCLFDLFFVCRLICRVLYFVIHALCHRYTNVCTLFFLLMLLYFVVLVVVVVAVVVFVYNICIEFMLQNICFIKSLHIFDLTFHLIKSAQKIMFSSSLLFELVCECFFSLYFTSLWWELLMTDCTKYSLANFRDFFIFHAFQRTIFTLAMKIRV